jgi:CubicO group peptidase (beta-lactamase class C family)
MKNSILVTLAFLLSISIFSCSKEDKTAEPRIDIDTPAQLTSRLQDIQADSEFPGFALTIIKNDAILYQEAFGMANIEENKAYSNLSTQPIGSISKTFIAAALVKAIDQGYFTLETDINDILPIEIKNPKQTGAIIRVKHLVTHTSSLVDEETAYFEAYHILPGQDLSTAGAQLLQDGFGLEERETNSLDDFLSEYYLEDGQYYSLDNFANTTPGTNWQYSNIASSLAAYLIEAATGTPFKEYVANNILQPLGMNNTAYDLTELNPDHVATLYWNKDTALPYYANDSYPDGSINTCNEDLAKYLMDMMKGVRGESNTLFSKEGYELLFKAILPNGVIPSALGDNQGVFWVINQGQIGHDGSDPGTTCDLQFDRTGTTGYLLLTNMDASTDEHEAAWFEASQKINKAVEEYILAN